MEAERIEGHALALEGNSRPLFMFLIAFEDEAAAFSEAASA